MLREQDMQFINETAGKLRQKMEWVSEKSQDKIPYTTAEGTHDDKSAMTGKDAIHGDGINWWCNGFWGGMLWQMYMETGEQRYADIARVSETSLDQCFEQFYGLHHDVGFMYLHTAVADYRLTGNADGRRRGMHAAALLAGRFNPVGRFLRAWNDTPDGKEDRRGWAIIDCMMNIPLLYWASEETGDPRFRQIAMLHADTAMDNFIRPDGSVRHIVEFNPDTGERVTDYGGQGYEQGSCWTRGQAWGLYGFLISYRHTHKKEYLDAAKQIAHYFIANIPEDGIIPIDFRQPETPFSSDDTAAAIAACGLIEIARAVPELEQSLYMHAALKLLHALDAGHCDYSKENDCFLTNCAVAYHSSEHDCNIIYGDYFYMEAVFKLKGNPVFLW